MIKKILIGAAAVVALICIVAAFQSDELNVSRSTAMAAPPAAVFKVVNDFRQWDAWSPWSKLDPAMTESFEGPAEGVGAVYRWSGNSQVGEGTSRIVESRPPELVRMRLEFVRPMAGTNDVQFTFAPEGAGTRVTWSMQGKKPYLGKLMGMFIDCEKMCGDQFTEGLTSLKGLVESGSDT
jgi:carbon monoxide dehydrogenase subunit G